jgi:L-rhamnose-H+ transport protein
MMPGLIPIIVAGVSSGSFPAPSKGITSWKWEHIWVVYSFFALAFLPIGLALFFTHQTMLRQLAIEPELTLKVAAFGVLWGLGSLLFGVSLVRFGMAISNALVSGIVAFLGSVGPVLIRSVRLGLNGLEWLIAGLGLLALSLVLCVGATIARDRSQGAAAPRAEPRRQLIFDIFIVVMAGVMSAMINIGFAYGAPLGEAAKMAGCPPLLASLTVWIPVLLGGLIFNIGYPIYLISRDGSWSTFFNGKFHAMLWIRASSMGVLWFGAFLLYGIGASMMGNAGTVYGWAIFIALSILTSNAWGALTGEWSNSGAKPKVLMGFSTVLLISSLFLLTVQKLWR